MSVQGSVEDLRRLRALGACSPSRWRRCDVMSGGWKHLVRAACQGGVVVLMSRYVRRLYVHLCVQPVKVASRCPDVTCTMLTNPLWVYFSLQSCRVSGGRVFSDFVMPGAACGPDGAGRARDTPEGAELGAREHTGQEPTPRFADSKAKLSSTIKSTKQSTKELKISARAPHLPFSPPSTPPRP